MAIDPKKLRARRLDRGMTQRALALAVGVQRVQIARLEGGVKLDVRVSLAAKISKALKCRIESLLD